MVADATIPFFPELLASYALVMPNRCVGIAFACRWQCQVNANASTQGGANDPANSSGTKISQYSMLS